MLLSAHCQVMRNVFECFGGKMNILAGKWILWRENEPAMSHTPRSWMMTTGRGGGVGRDDDRDGECFEDDACADVTSALLVNTASRLSCSSKRLQHNNNEAEAQPRWDEFRYQNATAATWMSNRIASLKMARKPCGKKKRTVVRIRKTHRRHGGF